MVRSYAAEPVERETIERIVATVRRAPSAGFSQGQRLLVVTDSATRRRIAELVGEEEWTARGFEPWVSRAPVHVYVCTCEADYHDRYRKEDKLDDGQEIEWPVPFWYVDAGAAMMPLLLAAIDEGLAGGVFGVPVEAVPPVRELLALPDEITIAAAVTIGRPAPADAASEASSRKTQPRRRLEELVRWEGWS